GTDGGARSGVAEHCGAEAAEGRRRPDDAARAARRVGQANRRARGAAIGDPRMIDDELDSIVDKMYESSQANVMSFVSLPDASPLVSVTDDDRAAAARALDAAAARLNCPRPTLRFVNAAGRSRGQAERLASGACVVSINLSEIHTLDEIREVT